jgi:hypothetical protein
MRSLRLAAAGHGMSHGMSRFGRRDGQSQGMKLAMYLVTRRRFSSYPIEWIGCRWVYVCMYISTLLRPPLYSPQAAAHPPSEKRFIDTDVNSNANWPHRTLPRWAWQRRCGAQSILLHYVRT